jgi:hypothetical protein
MPGCPRLVLAPGPERKTDVPRGARHPQCQSGRAGYHTHRSTPSTLTHSRSSGRRSSTGHEECLITSRDGSQLLLFINVPEGKTVKNRLHLDLRPADQAAEVARLEALGARRVGVRQGDVS